MYACNYEGKRYYVGDKQGFLKIIVEFELRREDLRKEFLNYLIKVVEKETEGTKCGEAAAAKEN